VAGVEYYFKPELSLYANGALRFFSNPMSTMGGNAPAEIGANFSIGGFYAF
jgi:hypothetical protein